MLGIYKVFIILLIIYYSYVLVVVKLLISYYTLHNVIVYIYQLLQESIIQPQ